MNNTPQLKGTATHFIEVWNSAKPINAIVHDTKEKLNNAIRYTKKIKLKTIAVWHITPHPFIDINQFKTN